MFCILVIFFGGFDFCFRLRSLVVIKGGFVYGRFNKVYSEGGVYVVGRERVGVVRGFRVSEDDIGEAVER